MYTWSASKRESQSGRAEQPLGARRVGDEVEAPPRRLEPRAHRVPHAGPQPMRRVEENHGDATHAKPGGLAPVPVEEADQVIRHAEGAASPELARLVVRRQHEPGLAGEGEECGQAERLLALASPPGDREPVEPRIACQGELRPDPRGVPAVVRPGHRDSSSPRCRDARARSGDADRGSRGSAPPASRGARGSSGASDPWARRASRTRDSGPRGPARCDAGREPVRVERRRSSRPHEPEGLIALDPPHPGREPERQEAQHDRADCPQPHRTGARGERRPAQRVRPTPTRRHQRATGQREQCGESGRHTFWPNATRRSL